MVRAAVGVGERDCESAGLLAMGETQRTQRVSICVILQVGVWYLWHGGNCHPWAFVRVETPCGVLSVYSNDQ